MDELHVLPDAEKLTIAHLLTITPLTDIVQDHIGARKGAPYPRLAVNRVGGGPRYHGHIDDARLQLESWAELQEDAGGKEQASRVIRIAMAALFLMVDKEHEDGVVTDVRVLVGPHWLPDPKTNRPRYVADALLRVHPHPSS